MADSNAEEITLLEVPAIKIHSPVLTIINQLKDDLKVHQLFWSFKGFPFAVKSVIAFSGIHI